ncbi:uncharacterized protein LOC144163844 [Haemaphysalis longicornis]
MSTAVSMQNNRSGLVKMTEYWTGMTKILKGRMENGVIYSPHPRVEIPVCSLYTVVKAHLKISGDKIAVMDYTRTYTRAELLRVMERYAAGYQALGIKPGDHVCIHIKNCVESFVAMFGIIFAGATVILAKTSLTHGELLYQMKDGDANYILTDEPHAEKARKVCDELKFTDKVRLVLGEAPGFISVSGFALLEEKNFREVPVPDPRQELVGLIYTSGTTGLPKAVEVSHYSFVANLVQNASIVPGEPTDIFLGWNPITHISGFLYIMAVVCAGASSVIVSPALTYNEFIEVCTKYQVSSVFTFANRLNGLVNEMLRTNTCLEMVRKLLSGGSLVSEQLARNAAKVFPNLINLRCIYGLSEGMGINCSPGVDEINFTDIGVPPPNAQLKLLSIKDGKPVGVNEHGEIFLRTPAIMRGYYKKPEATAEVLDGEGWFRTGDLGYYDENYRLHYVERLKEMIKCMDNQVVPSEIELLVSSLCPGVQEICVVGLPHPEYGEVATAFVILKKDYVGKVTADDIKNIVAGNLAKHKHLYGGVYFPDTLPRTDTMKVRRSELQKNEAYRKGQ